MPLKNREKKLAYQSEYNKRWYENPDNAIKKKADAKIWRKKIRERNRDFFENYRKTHPCEKCGESHIGCLDFHHKDKDLKDREVSLMVHKGMSLERIMKEIEKCMVLCRNCHAKLHYDERNTGP